jgi:hypothetical protein
MSAPRNSVIRGETGFGLGRPNWSPALAKAIAVWAFLAIVVQPAVAQPATPTTVPSSHKDPAVGTYLEQIVESFQPGKELLPPAPKSLPAVVPLLGDDLADVPQLFFQDAFPGNPTAEKWQQLMGEQMVKIRKLNQKETDGFWKKFQAHRPDLAGLPLLMGDACRMPKEQLQTFGLSLTALRSAMNMKKIIDKNKDLNSSPHGQGFWDGYKSVLEKSKTLLAKKNIDLTTYSRSQVAGLMQVLATEPAPIREGLVNYLAEIPHPTATRALSRLAVFDPQESVRQLAIRALADRPRHEYSDIIISGLRYPWPKIAVQAATAAVQLKRTDLAANLVDMLDEVDPRLPVGKSVGDNVVLEAKQLVRLNHHQNCLMCHAPADANTPPMVVTAPMPVPGQPLPSFSKGYGKSKFQSENDIIVRIDMTYLRQDFSMLMPVPNANPWPAQQRFDFLVRKVQLTPAQAQMFRDKLRPQAGALSPYQEAAHTALRSLTGLDAVPTAQAWRKVLQTAG